MKGFVLPILISLWKISIVVGELPYERPIDSESIAKQLEEDASAFCDYKCRQSEDYCIRDPGRKTLARCENELFRVYQHNYQVCIDECRNRSECRHDAERCGCSDACRDRAVEIIRITRKSPKELIESLLELRDNPYKYRSTVTGTYDYIV